MHPGIPKAPKIDEFRHDCGANQGYYQLTFARISLIFRYGHSAQGHINASALAHEGFCAFRIDMT